MNFLDLSQSNEQELHEYDQLSENKSKSQRMPSSWTWCPAGVLAIEVSEVRVFHF
jgi:hypothetical protein